jgi:ATP-binding cassette subfamily C protein LapB
VRFGARPDGRFRFDGLSLDVAPGALVGLVGPNGCGRSALLRLIAGAAQPLAGSVRLDGQNLAVFDAVPARGAIALVTTDVALIGGTLLDNLTLRQPEAEPQVLALATEFGLDLVAAALPGGWHTPVGSGAVPLSRGICQRIGLVRALAQQPRILLLDDVTAQLDADGDARLGRMLVRLRGRTTTLLVSHRRSVLELADRVLRFKDGRLEPVA